MSNDVSSLGSILTIWAHPDDETFMAGGLLATAVDNGQAVVCVTATRGEAGVQDESRWPAEQLPQIRTAEMEHALQTLGVSTHHWLSYADGQCAEADESEAVQLLATLIDQYKPNTIITFPPDGSTGHSDHKMASSWARKAAQIAECKPSVYFAVQTQEAYDSFLWVLDEKFNMYFATDNPVFIPEAACDVLVRLSPECMAIKVAALKAHESQFTKFFDELGDRGMGFALGVEGLVHESKASKWEHP